MTYSLTFTGETVDDVHQQVRDFVVHIGLGGMPDAPPRNRAPRPLIPVAEPSTLETPGPTPAVDAPPKALPQKAAKAPKVVATATAPAAATAPRSLVDDLDLKDATLATLKEAFANGKRETVMALLARHGKGAKTFRELPDAAFPLIRKEIEAGALA